MGRRIDGAWEAVRERFGRSSAPVTPRRSAGEWMADAKDASARKIDDVKRGWDLAPDDQRRKVKLSLIVFLCVLLGISSGMLAFKLSGGSGPMGGLSGSEATALKAVQDKMKEAEKGAGATNMFHGAR
jgi:hypothetical protein